MSEVGEATSKVIENRASTNFTNIILESQNFWHSLQEKPCKIVSQVWHLSPEVAQQSFDLVLQNLPEYIDDSLKKTIKENHPTPILGYSLLMDERSVKAKKTGPYVFMMEIPVGLGGDKERKAWREGMNILNEIATDTLAMDILNGIKKTGPRSPMDKIVRLVSKLPGGTPELSGINEAKQHLTNIMTKSDYDEFRKILVVAMLKGDTAGIEGFLEERGLDSLDKIALQLGEKVKYGGKTISTLLDRPRLAKALEKIRFPLGSGFASISYPGVLSMYMIPAINNPQSIPRVVIHEICHYIGQDLNHFGLFGGEYKRSSDL